MSGTLNEFWERSCRVNCSHFQSARKSIGEGTFSAETRWRRQTFKSLARESWSCSEGFTDPFEFMVHDNRDDQTVVLLIRQNFMGAKVCIPLSRDERSMPQ